MPSPVGDGLNEAATLEATSPEQRPPRQKALSFGRAFFVCWCVVAAVAEPPTGFGAEGTNGDMTVDEAVRLGEEFGISVGEVDEEIQKELKLQRPEGVAVFEVIGVQVHPFSDWLWASCSRSLWE